MYDQVARNRMREKLTASLIFKNRKSLYALRYIQIFAPTRPYQKVLLDSCFSVPHPFLGDYVRLRQNAQWKKLCVTSNDQYIVFADIINKITRSTGKVSARGPKPQLYASLHQIFPLSFKIVPILMALSTSSMLLLDQRTLQIKYRIPATEIYRLSLSPFHDNIAVFHVKAVSDWSGEKSIICVGVIDNLFFSSFSRKSDAKKVILSFKLHTSSK